MKPGSGGRRLASLRALQRLSNNSNNSKHTHNGPAEEWDELVERNKSVSNSNLNALVAVALWR